MISNGANKTLDQLSPAGLPNVKSAVVKWFQPMSIFLVSKEQVAYQTSETMVEIKFGGTWQPLSAREVSYKVEGLRSYNWKRLHTDPTVTLKDDDVVQKDGLQYRVKGTWTWPEYGYNEYHLVEDNSGKGPEIEVTP